MDAPLRACSSSMSRFAKTMRHQLQAHQSNPSEAEADGRKHQIAFVARHRIFAGNVDGLGSSSAQIGQPGFARVAVIQPVIAIRNDLEDAVGGLEQFVWSRQLGAWKYFF